ncbi:MAG: DsbA family protein [Trueperaceae bacterium]
MTRPWWRLPTRRAERDLGHAGRPSFTSRRGRPHRRPAWRTRLAAPLLTAPLPAALLPAALALAALAPIAFAQLGDDPDGLMAGLAGYAPTGVQDGYVAANDFHFTLTISEGVAIAVEGTGALTDANVRFLGALIGAASGYGDGISGPVADFFRTNGADLAGRGEVPIEVMEYVMFVDVSGDPPGDVVVRFEPQRIDPERFPEAAHAIGPDDARYVVREFSDFQCPFCARYALEILPYVRDALLARGDVRFELHHYPLKSIHPNAVVAAEASECVAEEGGEDAFWSFHDALFEQQAEWSQVPDPVDTFVAMASELELPTTALATCLRTGRHGDLVETAYQVASRELMLTGTPTVFVNGLKLGDYGDVDTYLRLMRLGDAIDTAQAPTGEDGADGSE